MAHFHQQPRYRPHGEASVVQKLLVHLQQRKLVAIVNDYVDPATAEFGLVLLAPANNLMPVREVTDAGNAAWKEIATIIREASDRNIVGSVLGKMTQELLDASALLHGYMYCFSTQNMREDVQAGRVDPEDFEMDQSQRWKQLQINLFATDYTVFHIIDMEHEQYEGNPLPELIKFFGSSYWDRI